MTYDYVCKACGHRWEAEQRITEAALTECPHCHAASAKREISGGAGFILKGGGWYSDLYSSAKPADSSKADGGAAKPSAPTPPCAGSACGTAACPAAAAAAK